MRRLVRTSLFVTGLLSKVKCNNFLNPPSGCRSVSSDSLFLVRTSVVRLGMLVERLAWMVETRFCARKSVRRRGWRGKLPSCAMSLSVKSIASFSYTPYEVAALLVGRRGVGTYACSTHVLDRGDFMAYILERLISIQLFKCSICSFVRTSQIEFTLLDRVEVGLGVVYEICGEPHVGGLLGLLRTTRSVRDVGGERVVNCASGVL